MCSGESARVEPWGSGEAKGTGRGWSGWSRHNVKKRKSLKNKSIKLDGRLGVKDRGLFFDDFAPQEQRFWGARGFGGDEFGAKWHLLHSRMTRGPSGPAGGALDSKSAAREFSQSEFAGGFVAFVGLGEISGGELKRRGFGVGVPASWLRERVRSPRWVRRGRRGGHDCDSCKPCG